MKSAPITATSADDDYWNSGSGWNPIGAYTATLRGNGHTISYLYINRSSSNYMALFERTGAGSSIEGVGMPHANVHGQGFVGSLAGNPAGTIAKSWSTGRVEGTINHGGLVGWNRGPSEPAGRRLRSAAAAA